MVFNCLVNKLLEGFTVMPRNRRIPGADAGVTGKNSTQGNTTSTTSFDNKPLEINGELLPSPTKLNLVKSIEARAKHLQKKKQKPKQQNSRPPREK